jgi:outer membrane protein OmpA-like peptidoglycan-associated protein
VLLALAGALALPAAATRVAAKTAKKASAKPLALPIFFDWGHADLAASAKELIAVVHKATKPGAHVTIDGYCDASEENPDRLSASRAVAVLDTLVAFGTPHGVTFTVAGRGVSKPRKSGEARDPLRRYVIVALQ